MKHPSFAVAFALTCAISSGAVAAVPAQITVQGRVTDAADIPLSPGPHTFTFRIFNAFSGGTQLWPAGGVGDVQIISTYGPGLWVGFLGDNTPLTDVVFADTMRWLEIDVDGTTLPRVLLMSAPTALRVATVDGAAGGWIATKVAIGPGTSASGVNAFAAGESDSATGDWAVVGGGKLNIASSEYSTVAGGLANSNKSHSGFIGGGAENVNLAGASYAVIGGGADNQIGTGGSLESWGTIAGGTQNRIGTGLTSTHGGAIGGGQNNSITGSFGCVPGGVNNRAGLTSIACGNTAYADNVGCFVFCDGTAPIGTTNDGQFVARASNGFAMHSSPGFTGCWLFANASAWSPISDSSMKENRRPVDGPELLKRLAAIPVETWNYIEQGDSIRHIGPMAQDFYRAFGVGESERHISTIDADGVALAAIQALNEELKKQRAENDELRAQIYELRRRIEN